MGLAAAAAVDRYEGMVSRDLSIGVCGQSSHLHLSEVLQVKERGCHPGKRIHQTVVSAMARTMNSSLIRCSMDSEMALQLTK